MLEKIKKKPKWMLLILVGVLLVSIKRIFTDFNIDCEYAIALSYRMVRGDRMIAQMWEPHQTSAFLNAFFIAIYLLLTGTTTGIAIYLNAVGLAVKLGVAYLFYRTFRKYCNRDILFLMISFFLAVNAKESIILEFSNMMIYFSILLLCTLFLHLQSQKIGETMFLVLAAIFFCLEVLSYPSVIILFPVLLLLLYRYSTSRRRDMILFTGICLFAGSAFLAVLVSGTGWDRFWECVRIITTGDSMHQVGDFSKKLGDYFTDIKATVVLFAVCGGISALFIGGLGRRRKFGAEHYVKAFFVLLLLANFLQALLDMRMDGSASAWEAQWLYPAIYLPASFLAFRLRKYCSREERMVFQIGMGISVTGCIAVLMLTNLTLMTSLCYLILGVMVSMMPIGEYLKQKSLEAKNGHIYWPLILFVGVFVFRNIYVLRPMSIMPNVKILHIRGVVEDGPMAGIFSDYMGADIANSNLRDWKQYVKEGDRVLIVGTYHLSTIGYLYEDTEISVDSTICTPTYNEKLLSYWEMNPWKEPNVVVLDCWSGESRVSEDEWIMGWIEENFDSYVDGRYVRIYRRG